MRKTTNRASDRLDTEGRKELKASDFGLPERREFPMPDAPHVRAAEAYFRYAPAADKPLLARRILLKAKKFGVNIQSPTVLKYAQKA